MTTKTILMIAGFAAIIASVSLIPALSQQNVVATIYCSSDPCDGTSSRDIMIGTSSGETINGFGGNDNIYGFGGADTINGGSGDDNLYHNSSAKAQDNASDALNGSSGYDRCHRNTVDGDTLSGCEQDLAW